VTRALATIFAALLVSVCVTPKIVARDHPRDVQQLRWLDRADPERDVSVAIARGDMRFIGIYGIASEVPCVSDARLRSRYGVRFLAGT
jgi:type IV pilus biogenesis protein CpaD/CtpE